MESQFSLPAGQSLERAELEFRAYGAIVENISNQWYYEPSRRRFIPPYQAGVTIPLGGSISATLQPLAPGITQQQNALAGEYLTVTFTDQVVPAGLGINVGSFTAPPPIAVTDYAQSAQPAPPGVGNTRQWADVAGELHRLLSNSQDAQLIDTSVVGLVTRAMLAANAATNSAGGQSGLGGATTSATPVIVPSSTLNLTTVGGPVLGWASLTLFDSVAGAGMGLYFRLDGGAWTKIGQTDATGINARVQVAVGFSATPAAGAHTFDLGFATSAGQVSIDGGLNNQFLVVELRR